MTEMVQWGSQEYDADLHARSALTRTPQAGRPTSHVAGPQLSAAAADRLFDLRYSTWGFGDSVAFDALIAASAVLGDERWIRFAHGWARAWATRSQPFVRLDCTAPGAAMVSISRTFGDTQLLEGTRALADYLTARPKLSGVFETWASSPLLAPYSGTILSDADQAILRTPPPGVFIDCLHFDPPFFAALGVALEDDRLVTVAKEQALGYVELLQQDDGLFAHFVLEGDDRGFGIGWGRGQGWALLGLLDVIETLAVTGDVDGVAPLREAVDRAVRALLALQRPDGTWFAVVDRPESGDESSTAAFMAVAFRRAAALGIGGAAALRAAADHAVAAVMNSLDERARLRGVSAAVYASTELAHYDAVPRGYVVPWGQGPAVLALLGEERRG